MQVAHGLYEHQPMKIAHLCLWKKNRRKLTSYRKCVPEVFLEDRPLWIKLCKWLLHQGAVDVLWLQNILWADESAFCVKVCPTVMSGRTTRLIRGRVYQFNFNINVWIGFVGDIVLGPLCYQTG